MYTKKSGVPVSCDTSKGRDYYLRPRGRALQFPRQSPTTTSSLEDFRIDPESNFDMNRIESTRYLEF